MMKRFTLWLVNMFLSVQDLIGLVLEKSFIKNPGYTVAAFIRAGNKHPGRPEGFPESTNAFLSETLLRELGLEGSIRILTLLKIKEYVYYGAPDNNEESLRQFFQRVEDIKAESSNPLRTRKALADLVSQSLILASPNDVTAIVNTLLSHYTTTESTIKFLTGAK